MAIVQLRTWNTQVDQKAILRCPVLRCEVYGAESFPTRKMMFSSVAFRWVRFFFPLVCAFGGGSDVYTNILQIYIIISFRVTHTIGVVHQAAILRSPNSSRSSENGRWAMRKRGSSESPSAPRLKWRHTSNQQIKDSGKIWFSYILDTKQSGSNDWCSCSSKNVQCSAFQVCPEAQLKLGVKTGIDRSVQYNKHWRAH